MLEPWVFQLALGDMTLAVILYLYVLIQQAKSMRLGGDGQPLRRLVLLAVLVLILGALPLMYVYANIIWFHENNVWIVYFAVLTNAASKLAEGLLLTAIYRYRLNIDE